MLWFKVNDNIIIIITFTESVIGWTQSLYLFLVLSQSILSCGIFVLKLIASMVYGDTQPKEPGELPCG